MSEEDTVQVNTKKLQLATFAAGCFQGVEEAFRETKGVKSTIVGYTGGWFNDPTYRDVCTGKTGDVEAIQAQFDPNEVSYEDLLDVFWSIHNPTTKNRQGPDIGSQYRSMIAYHTPEQESIAKRSKEDLEYHQKYFTRLRNIIRNITKSEVAEAAIFNNIGYQQGR